MNFKPLVVGTGELADDDDDAYDDVLRAEGRSLIIASDFAGVDMPAFAFGPHGLGLRASHLFCSDSNPVRYVANKNQTTQANCLTHTFYLDVFIWVASKSHQTAPPFLGMPADNQAFPQAEDGVW